MAQQQPQQQQSNQPKKFLNLSADIVPSFVARKSYDENALFEDDNMDADKLGELRNKSSNDQRNRSSSNGSAKDLAPPLYMDGFRPRAESSGQ